MTNQVWKVSISINSTNIISLPISERLIKYQLMLISINYIDITSLLISGTTNQISINVDINKLY
jgi:hypothetical protein